MISSIVLLYRREFKRERINCNVLMNRVLSRLLRKLRLGWFFYYFTYLNIVWLGFYYYCLKRTISPNQEEVVVSPLGWMMLFWIDGLKFGLESYSSYRDFKHKEGAYKYFGFPFKDLLDEEQRNLTIFKYSTIFQTLVFI